MNGFERFVNRIPAWARWLLFLPGACLAAALVDLVIVFIAARLPDWFFAHFLFPLGLGMDAYYFIVVGAIIVPTGRKIVAVFLALIVLFIALTNVIGTLQPGLVVPLKVPYTIDVVVLGIIATAIGVCAALVASFRNRPVGSG